VQQPAGDGCAAGARQAWPSPPGHCSASQPEPAWLPQQPEAFPCNIAIITMIMIIILITIIIITIKMMILILINSLPLHMQSHFCVYSEDQPGGSAQLI